MHPLKYSPTVLMMMFDLYIILYMHLSSFHYLVDTDKVTLRGINQ